MNRRYRLERAAFHSHLFFAIVDVLRNPMGLPAKELEEHPPVTIGDVDGVRKMLGAIAKNPDATERGAAIRAIDHIDEWIDKLKPEHVLHCADARHAGMTS